MSDNVKKGRKVKDVNQKERDINSENTKGEVSKYKEKEEEDRKKKKKEEKYKKKKSNEKKGTEKNLNIEKDKEKILKEEADRKEEADEKEETNITVEADRSKDALIDGETDKKIEKDNKGESDKKEEKDSFKYEVEDLEDKKNDQYAIVPPNGGWGWMVVATAFYCNVVTDGIQLSYGIFMEAISSSLNAEYSKVALAGSMMFGIHLLMGPICSGITTVFGLRLVTVLGSLMCAVGVALSYFATNFYFLCLTYGLIGGMGLGLVYMNSLVITGLYFTSLMPIAVGIVVCGTGVGTMIFAALGQFLLNITTWRNTMLINSALSASMALAALAFKPLVPIKVKLSRNYISPESLHSDTSMSQTSVKTKAVFIKRDVLVRPSVTSTRTIQSYIWNAVLQDTVLKDLERKQYSRCPRCKLCDCWKSCKCCKCCKCCKRKEKKEDILMLAEVKDFNIPEIAQGGSLFEKTSHSDVSILRSEQTSPAASYLSQDKKQKTQTVYQRVEYQEKAKKNCCQYLKDSIVATMDCHLLQYCSFFLFTLSGALQMAALLVVYIYEKDRCKDLGFSDEMSVYFVIALGGANTFWRLFLGGVAAIPKVNAHIVAIIGITIGGVATLCSGLSSNIYYQFAFCFFYSLGMASFAVFRLVLLLELVKPEESPNATGINLLFMGFFCILAPPLSGWAMELTHSYDVIFLSSGFIIIAAAILLVGVKKLRKKELEKLNDHS